MSFGERPRCRLEWLGRARMALGRPIEARDDVDHEAVHKWPDPPSSLVPLDTIDPNLWPEHLEHRKREQDEARRKAAMAAKERARS